MTNAPESKSKKQDTVRPPKVSRRTRPGGEEFQNQWQASLGATSQPVEVIVSIHEAGINHVLAKHFEYDRNRYTLPIKRTLPDGQMNRVFSIEITAEAPITVELPPFAAARNPSAEENRRAQLFEDPRGWDDLGLPDAPSLRTSASIARASSSTSSGPSCTTIRSTGNGTLRR